MHVSKRNKLQNFSLWKPMITYRFQSPYFGPNLPIIFFLLLFKLFGLNQSSLRALIDGCHNSFCLDLPGKKHTLITTSCWHYKGRGWKWNTKFDPSIQHTFAPMFLQEFLLVKYMWWMTWCLSYWSF